jgi:hypothetical protein
MRKNLVHKERNQMTLKRLLMPLFLLGIMTALGSMAFAQTAITCGLSVPLGPTLNATDTGHTEPIAAGSPTAAQVSPPNPGGGALRVTCVNTGGVGSASDPGVVVLTVSLGVPITNNTAGHPSATAQIQLSTTDDPDGAGTLTAPTPGVFVVGAPSSTAPLAENVHIASLNASGGQIVISLGTGGGAGGTTNGFAPTTGITFTAGPSTHQFDITGILVSTNGKTGPITATLVSNGGVNVGTIPTPASAATVNVITNVLRGLKDPTVPTTIPTTVSTTVTGGAAVLNSAGVAVGGKNNFAIRIEENYADMFREASQFNGPGTAGVFPQSPSSDTQVEVRLNNMPTGLLIQGCSAVLTDLNNALSSGSPSTNFSNFSSTAPVLTVNFNAAVDLANVDVLWILCTSVSVGTAALPLPSTPITATVNLAPTGIAVSTASGNPALTGLTTGQIPRYQLLNQPATALPVVVFPPASSNLLISFAAVLPGYDTGIAVANTTADPFTPTGGGASPSEGTVTFAMYKNDGTSKSYTTTTGSPGAGMTGAGVVKSGSTLSVNLSQVLTAATFGPTFVGYIFVTTNFTNAHGSATVYTTANGNAALSSPVLVVVGGAGAGVSTASPRNSPESLGQ